MVLVLLVLKINKNAISPSFLSSVEKGECDNKNGLVAYYSNRCPFAEYHVKVSLLETAEKRNIPLEIIKLETFEEARFCPSPATIFSLFYNGKFVTTDISVCMHSRFDKFVEI